jgi:hypothetical protein
VQDRRCDRPRRVAYAICSRRTGTLTFSYGDPFITSISRSRSASSFFSWAFSFSEPPQSTHVVKLKRSEPLLPGVDRLFADTMLLGHYRNRVPVGLPKHRHDLLVLESRLRVSASCPEASLLSNLWSENLEAGQPLQKEATINYIPGSYESAP